MKDHKKNEYDSIIEKGKDVIRKEAQAIFDLEKRIDDNFARAVDIIYNCKGRVIISGMGKSGIIGRKIAATLTSTGTATLFLHPAEGMHGDLGLVHKDDVVICISKSGHTHELFQLVPLIKRIGVPIISITGNRRSRLAERSDVILDASVNEEACPNNLAPTSSTTVALVLGDALAVALLDKRNFRSEDFALLHPGGSLGKQLTQKIDDIMFTGDKIPVVPENMELEKVIFEITSKRFGSTCVIDKDKSLVGIITDGDIRRLLEKKKNIWQLKAKEVMSSNPKTVPLGIMAVDALKIMTDFSIMQVIIVDEKNIPRGIIHLHDILEAGIL
ncbi:KpsF/GutQ family sugar-phosphate isomerase [candidate division KSB1 bacterium]|nr:KpsF/GutQ family sugar-phosphate isomerase [candidate division KSB1 bacterium]